MKIITAYNYFLKFESCSIFNAQTTIVTIAMFREGSRCMYRLVEWQLIGNKLWHRALPKASQLAQSASHWKLISVKQQSGDQPRLGERAVDCDKFRSSAWSDKAPAGDAVMPLRCRAIAWRRCWRHYCCCSRLLRGRLSLAHPLPRSEWRVRFTLAIDLCTHRTSDRSYCKRRVLTDSICKKCKLSHVVDS